MDERIANVVLRWGVDKRSLADVQRSNAEVAKLLGETRKQSLTVEDAAKRVNKELAEMAREKAVRQLAQDFARAAAEGTDLRGSLESVAAQLSAIGASDQEIRSVVRELERMEEVAGRTPKVIAQAAVRPSSTEALGDTSTTLGAAASVVSAGGNNPLAEFLRIGGDAAGLAEYLPRAADGMKNLRGEIAGVVQAVGAGNIGMIGAIGAAAIAIKLLADEAARVKEKSDVAIKSIQDYNRLVATGTTESLAEQREAAAREFELAQKNFDQSAQLYFGIIEGTRQQFGEAGLAVANFNAAIGTGSGELKSAEAAYYDAQKALDEASTAVNTLDRALQSSEVAANDAAAAQERIAAAQAAQAALVNDTQLNTLVNAFNMTSESLNERIAQIEHERAVYQSFIDAGAVQDEQLEQYRQHILALNVELSTLQMTVAGEVQAREAQIDATKRALSIFGDFGKSILDLASDTASAVSKFSETGKEIGEVSDKLDADLDKLRAAYDKAVGDANQKLTDGLKEAGDQLREQQEKDRVAARKALAEFEADERARKKAHRDKLAEIDRQYDVAEAQAVGDRNVVALEAAKTTRDEAKRAENERFETENEARSREFANLKASIRAQEQETLNSYRKREAALIAQNQRELAAAYQKYQADFNARQQAYLTEVGQLQQALSQEIGLKGAANSAVLSGTASYVNSMIGLGAKLAGASIGNIVQAAGKSPLGNILNNLLPKFATEGRVTRSGMAFVDKGEVVVKESRFGAGNLTFSPVLNGSTRAELEREFMGLFGQFLTMAQQRR